MSHRPIQQKKLNKLRKLMRSTPYASINLVEYLKDRGFAQTTGEAKRIILARRVMLDSHTLGIGKALAPDPDKLGEHIEVDIVQPLVAASYRDRIIVKRGRKG